MWLELAGWGWGGGGGLGWGFRCHPAHTRARSGRGELPRRELTPSTPLPLTPTPNPSPLPLTQVASFHAESSSHRPGVTAYLLYDDDALYVRYEVEDRYVRAHHRAPNSPVYHDSCVEIFLEIRPHLYTNLEMNCVGGVLLGRWHEALTTDHWPLTTGHLPLTTGHWPLRCAPGPLA